MSNLWTQIKNAASDIASLTVTTLEAEITLGVTAADGQPVAVEQLFDSLTVQPINSSTATIAAITHVNFDKDTTMIVGKDADSELVEKHQKTVQDAVMARTAVVDLFVDALKR